MKIVALLSGGKDSVYNLMECIAMGHELVCVANLHPPLNEGGKNEIDSFMYQSVGVEIVPHIAQCLGVPIIRSEIKGKTLNQELYYAKAPQVEEAKEEEEVDEVAELRAELDETREAVKFMRDKLNEVNLLNAKLLFTNKLFRAYGLNNEQKMKVVETFDRASNIREVKLVYSTMAETFGGAKKNEIQESKGSASKAVASTKSEKQTEVISEGNALRDRFKKLANII